MTRTLLARSALALALAAAGAAHAQSGAPVPGAAEDPLVPPTDDWAGYAHVGYHLDPHWRVELQGGYKAAAASPAASAPGGGPGFCGDPLAGAECDPRERRLGTYSAVASLIFDAMPYSRWVDPFIDLGVGVDRFDPGRIALANPAAGLLALGAEDSQLGYQALLGLTFRPRERLHIDLTYRWVADVGGPTLVGPLTSLGGRFQDQTLAISVRYALSSPRRAIAPAPSFSLASVVASPPPNPVLRAPAVETPPSPTGLAAEAAAAEQADVSAAQTVDVDAQADADGGADYNHRLAERRAKAMADALAGLGVPAASLQARWTGTEPGAAMAPSPKPGAGGAALEARAE